MKSYLTKINLVTIATLVTIFGGVAFAGSAFATSAAIVVNNASGSGCANSGPMYCTIQAAIDAANPGDVINVYPGNYNETASDRTLTPADGGGTYQFGLFIGTNKAGLTVQGVDAGGNPITDYHNVVATITTNATNGFGPSGVFVEGANVTLSGLNIGANSPDQNKTIEVIGDNFTLQDSKITEPTGGDLYISDFSGAGTTVNKYTVEGNLFADGATLDIASGAGASSSSPAINRQILNNTFSGAPADYPYALISFDGAGGQPWYVYPVGGAVITGNTFVNGGTINIRARGTYVESQFDWNSYWQNNTFDKAVAVFNGTDIRPYSYTASGVSFTNVRQIGTSINTEVGNAQAGDTVKVAAGTYSGGVNIPVGLTLDGPNAGINPNVTSTSRVGEAVITSGNPAIAINTTAPVTISGFTFNGTGSPIKSGVVGTAPTVTNNIIENTTGGDLFFQDAKTLTLSNNQLSGLDPNVDAARIIGSDDGTVGTNATIMDNVWKGSGVTGTSGINATNIQGTVSGNTFSNLLGYGLLISNNSTLTVSNNTFSGIVSDELTLPSWGAGVRFYTPTLTQPVTITGNTFTNDVYGVASRPNDDGSAADLSKVAIIGNSFVGDTAAGVYNTPKDSLLNATGNWWGDVSGPKDTVSGDGSTPDTNATGTGSPAIGAVNYGSWCTNSVCDEVPPTVTVTPVAGSLLHGTETFTITVTDNNPLDPTKNKKVWVYLYNSAGAQKSQGASVDLSNGTGIFTVDTTKLDNGDSWLDVGQVFDAAGNPSGSGDNYFKDYDVENNTTGPSIPTLLSPVNGDITPTNNFIFTWNPSTASVAGPITYEFHSSMNSAETDGVLTTGVWDSGTLTTPSIVSSGAPDGTWYWQVRAKDSAGNVSAWSDIWAVTLNTVSPPSLATCPEGTTPTLVETDAVNSNSSEPTVGANNLTGGQTYLLVASGTWQNGGINVADTAYASVDNWTTYMQGYNVAPYTLGSGEFQLQVNGSFINWGAYQPSHQYSYLYTGTGSPVSLTVFDGDSSGGNTTPNTGWYGDNSGNLAVNVYSCKSNAPIYVTTEAATNVSSTYATVNGMNGSSAADNTSFWWGTTPAGPFTAGGNTTEFPSGWNHDSGLGSASVGDSFSGSLTNLTPSTTYYFVAWSLVNGTWYPGVVMNFTTAPAAYVTTEAATDVTSAGATLNGTNGVTAADNTSFWWGTTPAGPFTAGGNTTEFPSGWNHDSGLGSASVGNSFSEPLTGLTPGTTYYYVAWSYIGGTWYPGAVMNFIVPSLDQDATLSALSVSAGVLNPVFSPGVTSYTDSLPYYMTTPPTVAATTTVANATDTITQAVSNTGTALVNVTAQDGTTKKQYTVNFSVTPTSTSLLKVAVVVVGGSATSSDFTVNLLAAGANPSTFPGDPLGTEVTMNGGASYNVNVTSSASNYTLGTTGTCNGESTPGYETDCTVTETYSAAPLALFSASGGRAFNTITVMQGANGIISPATLTNIASGANETFTIAPATGYQVADVKVDGASVGAVTTYTFTGVNGNHAITASFSPVSATGSGSSSSTSTNQGEVLGESTSSPQGQVLGASVFNFGSDLSLGSQGPDVTELQKALTTLGFYKGAIDGYFGPLTQAAVKAFQKKYGLPVTGYFGPLTRAKLNALLDNGLVLGASTTQSSLLQAQLLALLQQLLALLQSQSH